MSGPLFPQHVAYFAARAVPLELAMQRGCRSASDRQARQRGFRVPLDLNAPDHPLDGLEFTIHRPDGGTSYQLRLDVPIPDPDKPGKVHRYLNLPGKPAKGIDVHPSNLARLAGLSNPRILTEGIAHVDSITGAGWLGIGVTGVWMGVLKREDGTYTLHPDLEQAAPPGSIVFMGFDPDQMTKVQVHDALRVTSGLLKARGCLVLYLHVPATFNGQPVDGIDTYLAVGGSMAELIAGATTEISRLGGSDGAQGCRECPELRAELALYRSGNWSHKEAAVVERLVDMGDYARRRGKDSVRLYYPKIAGEAATSPSTVGKVVERLAAAAASPLPIRKEYDQENQITRIYGDVSRESSKADFYNRLAVLGRPGATETGGGTVGGARPGAGRPSKGCPKCPNARLVVTTRAETSCQHCGQIVERWIVGKPRIIESPDAEPYSTENGPPETAAQDEPAAESETRFQVNMGLESEPDPAPNLFSPSLPYIRSTSEMAPIDPTHIHLETAPVEPSEPLPSLDDAFADAVRSAPTAAPPAPPSYVPRPGSLTADGYVPKPGDLGWTYAPRPSRIQEKTATRRVCPRCSVAPPNRWALRCERCETLFRDLPVPEDASV
jgi:Domain of unknown function (DUF3854)